MYVCMYVCIGLYECLRVYCMCVFAPLYRCFLVPQCLGLGLLGQGQTPSATFTLYLKALRGWRQSQ